MIVEEVGICEPAMIAHELSRREVRSARGGEWAMTQVVRAQKRLRLGRLQDRVQRLILDADDHIP